MDSWPLKEKMGVTSRAALHRPDQSYQATVAGFTLGNAKSWVGLVGHFNVWCFSYKWPLVQEAVEAWAAKIPESYFSLSSQWSAIAN